MHPSPTEFKTQFRHQVLELIWRQWAALGVAGHAVGAPGRAIDAEGLLLATCHFGRHEPRMFDEMLDWLAEHGWMINTQRLAALLRGTTWQGVKVLAAIAAYLDHGTAAPKWRRLARSLPRQTEPENLFFLPDGRPLPVVGEPEPHFAAFGLLRGPLRLRGHSQPFRPFDAANLVLQLRGFFGINVRAEIAAYLLTHETGHPSEIARDTYYHKRSIQQALGEMHSAGMVEVRQSGRSKRYWLRTAEWRPVLNRREILPVWNCWPPMYQALEIMAAKLGDARLLSASPLIQSSELRQLMIEVRPLIERAGFASALSDDRRLPGESYLPVFMADVLKLLDQAMA